jgi:hypothetical protein
MQSLMLRGSAAGSAQVVRPKPARPALPPLPLVSGLSRAHELLQATLAGGVPGRREGGEAAGQAGLGWTGHGGECHGLDGAGFKARDAECARVL